MEPKRGRLVRAIYDFPTDDENELPLLIGDIIQVTDQVDKQWSYGVCGNRQGNFPLGFTVDINTPSLAENQQLFAVTNDFAAQEPGDLTLKRGSLVIGNEALDSNWWKGEVDGQHGIFPLTHVWKIDKSSLPAPGSGKKMSLKAKVKMNMTAQLDEEMDLFKDDIVNIHEEVEKGWFRGECNGRQGIFPASFVTIMSNSAPEETQSLPTACLTNSVVYENTIQNDNQFGYDCLNSGITTPYGRTLYPFKAEYDNELSFSEGEIVNIVRHVDENWIEGEIDGRVGLFPANFVNIIVDCQNSSMLSSKEKENSFEENIELFPQDTYGRVIEDFYPHLEGCIRLNEGDTVTLLRKINQNWYEIITDNGDTGLCPDTHIEVIGSGPPSYFEVMSSNYDGNNSLIDIDSSFSSDGKNEDSKHHRQLSVSSSNSDSSFSSQKNSKNVSTESIDNKISESLKGLDSSLFTVSNGSSNNRVNKPFSNDFSNNANAAKQINDNNWNLPFQNDKLLSPLSESKNSWASSEDSLTAAINPSDNKSSKYEQRSSDSKTPARPPPPICVAKLPHNSKNGLTNSSGANRSSLSSSHGSSNGFSQSFDSSDIKQQLNAKNQKLKQRINCRNKLQSESYQTSNAFASNEIKTQIAQLDAEISELKSDIDELQNSMKLNSSENIQNTSSTDESNLREEEVARKKEAERQRREQEKMKKMKEQRECIITELLQTERDYISDLKLLQETFLRNPEEAKEKGIDIVNLFGNLDEVIEVANRLLRRLQKVSKETGLIGECFVDVCEEMKEVYGHYCRNHDEAHSVIDKIDLHSSAGQYITHKLEILKRQTNCFDLSAMLIKPVQRILKYPLLLNELLKCTEDGHPDKPSLLQAVNLMTDVATAVNEFKRKKDLVFKYRKQADTSLSGRISKFNMHSVAKKSSRLGMRLSSSFGLKTLVKDQEFEKVAKRFHSLDKTLKIFQKEVCEYSKKYEELVTYAFNIAEDIADVYQERKSQQEVDQFRSVHRIILTQFWESFKQNMERNVNSPIKMLLQAFRGPINLIHKRHDKLLDSLSATNKMEKNKDVTKIKMLQENYTMAKNNYEALNSQLLDDLPKLCDLSVEILYDCVRCFLKAKKNFIGRTSLQLFGLMDLPLLLGNRNTSILETFQVKHTLVTDDLCQISLAQKPLQTCIKTDTLKRNSSPRGSRLSFGGVNPILKSQTSSQKAAVKSKYSHTALYTACENFEAADIMDICLKKGNLVGVIKQQDPMGNRLRWFVDDGDAKGFVPAKCLIKYIPDPSSPTDEAKFSSSNINSTSPTISSVRDVQKLYSLPQKKKSDMKSQIKQSTVQPVRPAPSANSSLRVVAPSRYPPTTQNASSNSQQNISCTIPDKSIGRNLSSTIQNDNEPMHRYEEINEATNLPEQNVKISDTESDKNSSSDPNILEEFDPYSTNKLPEVYDNVPDNLNCLYSSHRYEDVPDITYDEVPQEDADVGSSDYYFAMYDFSPTGPNQQSLYKGQVVLVLHKCDLNRNSEWWFIEDRHGNKGYVPGAYLNKYLKDA